MAEVIGDIWTRPRVRLHAARRSVVQAIEMLTDDTLPSSVKDVLGPLGIVSQLLAIMEEDSRNMTH